MPKNEKSSEPARVAIIGPENISASDVYALLVRGFIREIVLIGRGGKKLIEELEDLQRFVAFPHPSRVWKGDYEDASTAKVAIVTFGESSSRSTRHNQALIRGAAMRLKDVGFKGVLLVARDPVNLLSRSALEGAGLPDEKVIGLGVGPRHNGGVTWCTAQHSDVTFMDNCSSDCPYFEDVLKQPTVAHSDREHLRSFAPDQIAACVTQICDAVINDTHAVIPVYVRAGGAEFRDLPCAIGKNGVEEVIPVPGAVNGHSRPAAEGLT